MAAPPQDNRDSQTLTTAAGFAPVNARAPAAVVLCLLYVTKSRHSADVPLVLPSRARMQACCSFSELCCSFFVRRLQVLSAILAKGWSLADKPTLSF